MPSPLPSPPPGAPSPVPPADRRRRRPWMLAALALVLFLTTFGLVVLVRDRADADRADGGTSPGADAGADAGPAPTRPGPPPTGDGPPPASDAPAPGDASPPQDSAPQDSAPQDSAPQDRAPDDQGSQGLNDLLQRLMGSAGLPNLDPACVSDVLGKQGPASHSIEGDVRQQVEEIKPLVEQQRGLKYAKDVQPVFQSSSEFEQQLSQKTKAEYPDAQADLDGRLLGLLGAVPKGTDMKALQTELMAGQVAGYYDPDSGELVVRTPDGSSSLDANGQVTLAHELDHALTDQVLGLPDTAKPGQSDADLAQLGLVEGDATLLMEQFSLGSVSLLDQLGAAMSPDAAAAQRQLDGAPSYLRNQLMFPYLSGLSYVCRLYAEGGWPAVDAAYRDLPQTTAELLYPDRAGVAPKDPSAIASPGGGWTEAQKDTLGAAQLLWLFQAPGGDEGKAISDPAKAAQHWAGGDLALFTSGERSALGLALVDTADGGTLCHAVGDWYAAAFSATSTEQAGATVMSGDDQVGVLRCAGREVRLGIAPDESSAATLAH